MRTILTLICMLLLMAAGAGCGGPRDADAMLQEAAALMESGNYDQAAKLTAKAVAAAPGRADGRVLHAIALERLGDLAGAVREAEEAVKAEPDLFVARYTLGRLYAVSQRNPEALQALGKALELRTGDRNTLILLANVSMRLSPSQAMKYLVALNRDRALIASAAYKNQMGIGMLSLRNLRAGALSLREAQKREPGNPIYVLNLARVFDYYINDAKSATQLYLRFQELAAGAPVDTALLGEVNARLRYLASR